jgi:hypothetical protein
MGEEAALAHTELFGEGADGEAFQPLRRGYIHGARENRFAGAQAFGLPVEDGLSERLTSELFSGSFGRAGANRVGQLGIVTRLTNKHERSFIVLCSSA